MIAHLVKPLAYAFFAGKFGGIIAFLRDELTAHFAGCQAGIKPVVAKLRVGLALSVYNGFDCPRARWADVLQRLETFRSSAKAS